MTAPRVDPCASAPLRVAYITPLPTPYRQPLLNRLTELDDLDVTVFYCAGQEGDRSWTVPVPPNERHRFLPGFQIVTRRGHKTLYNHCNPSIWRALSRGDFDAVVTAGYALVTTQIAIAWALFHRKPYFFRCESHTPSDRSPLRRAVKSVFLRFVCRCAAGGLPTGSLARDYLAHYGMARDRMRFFPNTTDVHSIAARVDALRGERDEIKAQLGVTRPRMAMFVGRLIPAKAPLEMLEAFLRVSRSRSDWALAVVGDGELEGAMRQYVEERGLDGVHLLGFRQDDALLRVYAAADLFVLPSRQEPWAVVVNEAAAAGLPLLLSDAVGAAADLLEPGENGEIFSAVDVDEMTAAWLALSKRQDLDRMGERSREIVLSWDYDFAISELKNALLSEFGELLRCRRGRPSERRREP